VRVLGDLYFPQILAKGTDKPIKGFKGYLCSYDLFRRQNLEMWEDAGIQTVVIDECQHIKNPDASRTQAIRQVVKPIPKIIPLSGTPWKNRGSEFFTVLNILDPTLFWSYQQFKRQWVNEFWDGNKLKEGGIRNPDKFKETIKHIAIRRERTEVMPELPLVNRTRLVCEVPEHARNVYNQERDKLIKAWNEAILEGTEDSMETRRQMMTSLIIMRQIVGLAKVDTTVEFVKEFLEETDRKIVIFVHHIKCGELVMKQLTEFCAKENYPKPLQLTSTLDSSERFEIQDRFNKYARVLVASTLASGEGLNLQTCSDCIMHERQWNPANEEQAEGRFIRIGQQAQSVNATYVHGDKTIDTTLDELVEKKRIAFHVAMNKGEIVNWNETSLMKELIQELIKGK
jgi:SNF2 family DNA or RNA helicase